LAVAIFMCGNRLRRQLIMELEQGDTPLGQMGAPYLKNGGTLEGAAAIPNHASTAKSPPARSRPA
jgi:hypothetical protein